MSRGGKIDRLQAQKSPPQMLERLRRLRSGRRLAEELDEIALHCASLPVLDSRDAEEILGYDEQGLPS
jgi:antitoxin VapB